MPFFRGKCRSYPVALVKGGRNVYPVDTMGHIRGAPFTAKRASVLPLPSPSPVLSFSTFENARADRK